MVGHDGSYRENAQVVGKTVESVVGDHSGGSSWSLGVLVEEDGQSALRYCEF